MSRQPFRFLAAGLAFSLGLGVLAWSLDDDPEAPSAQGRSRTTTPEREIALQLAASLKPFDECGDLLDHVRTEATAHAGTLAFLGGWRNEGMVDALAGPMPPTAATAESGARASEPAADKATDGSGFSGTNVQEAGVDEPDTVKTDGRRLFTVARGRIQALEVTDGQPRAVGSLEVADGGAAQLLLSGDRLLAISPSWMAEPLAENGGFAEKGAAADMAMPGRERTALRLIDVSDPTRMRVLSTLEVDGHLSGARMIGDVVRVVTSAAPNGFRPMAQEENARQVNDSTLVNWLPSYRLTVDNADTGGPAVSSGLLVPCDKVSRPAEFSGLGTTTVLTFDLSETDLGDGDATSVLADAQTVYSSTDSLYVATTRHEQAIAQEQQQQQPSQPAPAVKTSTELHKFDIRGSGAARHVASGRVRGHLLNQFSLSDHGGHLRVATTDGFPGFAGEGSESFVTVLADQDGKLVTTGEVGNLGKGERIYAVRFLGDVGYVVTFRQVDPLYTLDLSDPTRPRMVGELKIPGYSAYLHPVGDGLLLGIGQDATDEGRRIGAQMSLFDVSDPAHPKRLHQAALGNGASAAEYDHHAFLWWGARRLAVVPVQTWDDRVNFSGVLGFEVTRDGLDEVGRVSHGGPGGQDVSRGVNPITRSLVVGDSLLTISDDGIRASGLTDFAELSWVPFS
jgi:hypothetical protein